jgi:hypothetical protein
MATTQVLQAKVIGQAKVTGWKWMIVKSPNGGLLTQNKFERERGVLIRFPQRLPGVLLPLVISCVIQ